MPAVIQTADPSSSMQTHDSILAHFDDVKARWMDEVLAVAAEAMLQATPLQSSLLPMADYHLATGGKRLRALIPLVVADALGIDPGRVLGFAAACEILHNATLVHDDLQDGDRTRRGEPTIWAKFGEARAINLGDAMLYWTLEAAQMVDFGAEARLRLTQRIVRDTLEVIDGQEREFLLQEAGAPTIDAYMRMVAGKTSGLFALPMAGTAELCGASQGVVHALGAAAGHLGILFQLQDDVLDLYGEKGRGQRGSDLGEGKISALVAHFVEHGPDDEVAWLRGVLRAPREELQPSDVERAARSFREHGTLQWVLDTIDQRHAQAIGDALLATEPELVNLLDGLATLFVAPIESVR